MSEDRKRPQDKLHAQEDDEEVGTFDGKQQLAWKGHHEQSPHAFRYHGNIHPLQSLYKVQGIASVQAQTLWLLQRLSIPSRHALLAF